MANMKLSTYLFPWNPHTMTMPRKQKYADKIQLYSTASTVTAIVYYSWGLTVSGAEIDLSWPAMPSTMFDQLDTLFQTDTSMAFSPEDGSGSYTVVFDDLQGEYLINLASTTNRHRQNVNMKLIILSTVAS